MKQQDSNNITREKTPRSQRQDHALAQLVVHTRRAGSDQTESLFNDAELAEALAEMAEGRIDASRREQLMEYLDAHPQAYESWLSFNLHLLNEETGRQPAVAPSSVEAPVMPKPSTSWLASLTQWLTTPAYGAGLAFAAILGLTLGWQLAPHNETGDQATPQLALNAPKSAPAKAAIEYHERGVLVKQLQCRPYDQQQFYPRLCYVSAGGRQHFYLENQDESLILLDSPLPKGTTIETLWRYQNHIAVVGQNIGTGLQGRSNLWVFDLQASSLLPQWNQRLDLNAGSQVGEQPQSIEILALDGAGLRYQVTDDGKQRVLEYHW